MASMEKYGKHLNNGAPLRVAFLGGGTNSAVGRAHRTSIEVDQRFILEAGCFSQYPEINAASALAYHVAEERTYSDLGKLLSAERSHVDAIVILTPTPQHKNDVIDCVSAGVPVICEKALALSSSEISEIKLALQEKKGFLAVTYNYSGYPMLRELREMVLNGKLGKIEQIHAEMPQEGFVRKGESGKPNTPQQWRLTDSNLPTLSLDLGVHLHHLIYFLTSERPLELVAIQNSFGSFNEVIDNAVCMVNYTNEVISNIWFSKSALGYRNGLRIRIFGDKGSVEWYQLEPENLHYCDEQGSKSTIDRSNIGVKIASQDRYSRFKAGHPSGFIEAFGNLYSDIADALIEYKANKGEVANPYVAGIDEALEGILMLEGIAESANCKGWVSLK